VENLVAKRQKATVAPAEPWHVLRVKPQLEHRTSRHLAGLVAETYYPIEWRSVWHGRRRVQYDARPLMPGYLFIRLGPTFTAWHAVRYTPGVIDWLERGGTRATMTPAAIEAIRAIEQRVRDALAEPLHAGELVELCTGSWFGLAATVQKLDTADRVVLSAIVMARSVRMTVPVAWVRLIGG
jgi:transcriptional antiterminator RfaH